MKNAEWMIKNGMEFSCLVWGHYNGKNSVYYDPLKHVVGLAEPPASAKELYSEKSTDVKNLITEWLDMEHKEQILDDAERRYLSAVIRPFRDRVKHICKVNYLCVSSSEYQYIFITLSDGSYNIDLPIFKRDTMYKGMKPGKDYTSEELGL